MDHSFWDLLFSFVLKILSLLNELVLTILKVMGQQNEIWVFLKKLLKKSARGGEDFIQQFYIMQNLPCTSEGLSPAQLFFQREVRSPMFYTPPCNKDEMGAGLQRHYDRERQ